MLKTYKYKLYPTKTQRELMHETTFLCSLIYNQCLAQRKEAWEREQKSISCYDQINQLPDLKEKDERFQSIFSQVLQDVIRRVDKASLIHYHLLVKVLVLMLGLKILLLLQTVSFSHLSKIYASPKRKLSALNEKSHGEKREASAERNLFGD